MQNRLRLWRARRGLTLDEVGDLTGYTASFISLIERGKRSVPPDTKVRIARCLGVRVRDLFEVEEVEEMADAG